MSISTSGHANASKHGVSSGSTTSVSKGSTPSKGALGTLKRISLNVLRGPLASFHILMTLFVILIILGLVMVLNASGPGSLAAYGDVYAIARKQVIFTIIGLVGFYIALQLPAHALKRYSMPFFLFSGLLLVLVLVPGIGVEVNGARSWFSIGSIALQPTEIAKIAIIVAGAAIVADRIDGERIRDIMVPMLILFVPTSILVVMERDLGMTVTFGIVLVAFLWFGRIPGWVLASVIGGSALFFLILTSTVAFRSARLVTYWQQFRGNYFSSDAGSYQSLQGLIALADGGLWGVGLGQSRAKFHYLPLAKNDFIFAIIGEELGFVGCLLVIGLFIAIAWVGFRISRRLKDPFLKILSAVLTTSIVSQAFINMGYVVGLLPVTGLQLPLISAGGTATVTTCFAFGFLANCARHEPEAIATIRSGRESRLGRLLYLREPVVYAPLSGVTDTPSRTGQGTQHFPSRRRSDRAASAGSSSRRGVRQATRGSRGALPVARRSTRSRTPEPWKDDDNGSPDLPPRNSRLRGSATSLPSLGSPPPKPYKGRGFRGSSEHSRWND